MRRYEPTQIATDPGKPGDGAMRADAGLRRQRTDHAIGEIACPIAVGLDDAHSNRGRP